MVEESVEESDPEVMEEREEDAVAEGVVPMVDEGDADDVAPGKMLRNFRRSFSVHFSFQNRTSQENKHLQLL